MMEPRLKKAEAIAFGGDAPRERGHERGGERAFGKKVAQHVGRTKRRQKRVHVAARAEHGRENNLANQSQNAAAKNRHAHHAGRARADSLSSHRSHWRTKNSVAPVYESKNFVANHEWTRIDANCRASVPDGNSLTTEGAEITEVQTE